MNLSKQVRDREVSAPYAQEGILTSLEEIFVSGHCDRVDYPIAHNIPSTIAIAWSSDGFYFASTHGGDHSVKVFSFDSHEQIANLRGHPRTPWTVKVTIFSRFFRIYHSYFNSRFNSLIRRIMTSLLVAALDLR
jgi:hypothetical protein